MYIDIYHIILLAIISIPVEQRPRRWLVTSDKLWDGWSLSHDAIGVIGAYRGVITGYLYEAGVSILE